MVFLAHNLKAITNDTSMGVYADSFIVAPVNCPPPFKKLAASEMLWMVMSAYKHDMSFQFMCQIVMGMFLIHQKAMKTFKLAPTVSQ